MKEEKHKNEASICTRIEFFKVENNISPIKIRSENDVLLLKNSIFAEK